MSPKWERHRAVSPTLRKCKRRPVSAKAADNAGNDTNAAMQSNPLTVKWIYADRKFSQSSSSISGNFAFTSGTIARHQRTSSLKPLKTAPQLSGSLRQMPMR